MNKIGIKCLLIDVVALLLLCIGISKVYADDTYYVYTGNEYNLLDSISDYSSDASFVVDDTTIVSVNSNGILSALQPGETVVSVTYTNLDGNTCIKLIDIRSSLEEGIYRIKNKTTGKYLCLTDIKTKNDSTLDLAMYSSSGDDFLCQLWRLESDIEDCFVIKPFSDNNAVLKYSSLFENIRIQQIPTYSEYVHTSDSIWYIGSDVIQTNHESEASSIRLNHLNIFGIGSENDKWSFELVSNVNSGIRLLDEYYPNNEYIHSRYMSIGSVKNLEDLKIKVLSYGSLEENRLIWSSGNNEVARVNSSTGEVTAVGQGTATITVTRYVGSNIYSASYVIKVTPYRDGFYSITNLLGNNGLEPFTTGGTTYLRRSTSLGESAKWYFQCLIDGTYEISIANNNTTTYVLLDRMTQEDTLDSTEYVVLQGHANNSADKASWDIVSNDLGKTIAYKCDTEKSWTLTDSASSLLSLCSPDYEDYESMWSINEISMDLSPKVYIHPFYDEHFLSLFDNDVDEMQNAINSYLSTFKNIMESELDMDIVIEDINEFVLSDNRKSKLNVLGVERLDPNGEKDRTNDAVFFLYQMLEDRSEAVGYDEYYGARHKYILYTGYDFLNYDGVSYDATGASNDCCIIMCHNTDDNEEIERCPYLTVHELAHTLGARDHYHNQSEDGSCNTGDKCSICGTISYKRPASCIMHYDYYNPNDPLCNECVIEMKSIINARCLE